jgi:hypothetical protein
MLINIKISANIVDLLFSDEVLGYAGGGGGMGPPLSQLSFANVH